MHTPGPWATDGYSVVNSNGDTPDGTYEIASVRKSADVDLIAAAPDLLAALEALCSGYTYLSDKPPSQKELWDNAFAAIAKAKT